MELLKILFVKSLEETRQAWTMFSKLKAFADSEKFQGIVFKYSTKNDNFELGISLPSMSQKNC